MRTEDTIRDFIVTELQANGKQLTDQTPLLEAAVLDSMGLFQLVSFLESEFEIEVLDQDLVPDRFGTIRDIARLVESKRA